MKIAFSIAAIALSFFAGGCAIHPLPEDVTGVPTYHIVRRIRCEARAAVIQSAIDGLKNYGASYDPEVKRIATEYDDGTRPIAAFSYKDFRNPYIRSVVRLFYDTGVAYNFNLEMTENNDIGTDINLLKPFTGSSLTMGISADFNRQRVNTRTFTITDTFGGLIRNIGVDYCDQQHMVTENYVYPITGRVGVEKMVHDFINMTLFANLQGNTSDGKGPPTLVDALEFTTLISGSATPRITFSPLGTGLSVTDASVTGKLSRTDLHKVTIGLAIDKGSVDQVAPLRSTLFTPLLTADGGRAEQKAAEAVNQALTSKLFTRTIVLNR
ncbi:hypothetical protein J6500_17755 [Bradyrhizobium sp. WSM 1704]|uniref:hypothetical protein n=1 Tax=Bradyrhizobium semiaridum TaxID=2821404 RepID=UPI001CE26FA5|nr:hypothetical protein [Bradyrhizobium semiaridum]MCA6123729.1 hypothetical protein [Bradyrhizobium semiaridum]